MQDVSHPSRISRKDIFLFILILFGGIILRLVVWPTYKSLNWDEGSHSLAGMALARTILHGFSGQYLQKFFAHYWASVGSLFYFAWGGTIASMFSYLLFGFNQLAARMPSRIFSVVLIHAVFLLGRRLYGSRVGLIAALLTAVNPWIIVFGGGALVDVPLTCLLVYSYYYFATALESDLTKHWVLSGVFMGCAFLMKPVALIVLPAYVIHYLLHQPKSSNIFGVSCFGWLVVVAFASYFGFGVLARTTLPALGMFTQSFGNAIYQNISHWFSGALTYADTSDPIWTTISGLTFYLKLIPLQLGSVVVVVLTLIGVLAGIMNKDRRRTAFGLLTYVAVLYIVFTILHNKDTRYTIPYIPICLIFAGLGIERFSGWFGRAASAYVRVCIVGAITVLVVMSTFTYFSHGFPDTHLADAVVAILAQNQPGLVVLIRNGDGNVDNMVNEQTLSFYLACADPELQYSAYWSEKLPESAYIIATSPGKVRPECILYNATGYTLYAARNCKNASTQLT